MISEALALHRKYAWNIMPVWWVTEKGNCGCGGLHVDDERSIGKHPILPKWKHLQEQKVTEDDIREWWTQWPRASIAVITGAISDLVVADDDRAGGEGLDRYGTLCSHTGGGGYHFFFRCGSVRLRSVNRADEHTDIKAEGGYVILPPSKHQSGLTYVWQNDLDMLPVPESVKILANGKRDVAVGGVHTQGSRNDAMMREVCSLFGKGLPPQEVLVRIRAWNDIWNFPPSPDKECINAVKSIWNNQEKPKRLESRSQREYPTGGLQIRTTEYMADKYGDRDTGWLIPHWLPAATCCIIGAPPETFKTWFMLDLAVSLSTGKPFLGHYPVGKTGRVLIVQQEDNYTGALDRMARLLGLGEVRQDGDGWYVPVPVGRMPEWTEDRLLNVQNATSMEDLKEYVAKYLPVAVIIDPFFSFVPLADDFGTAAAAIINSKIKPLRDDYDTTFVFLHHTNKGAMRAEANGTRKRDSLWGSQFLNAGLETAWHLRCDVEGGNLITVQRHTKLVGHEPNVRFLWHINDFGCSIREI